MIKIEGSKTEGEIIHVECIWCKSKTKHTVERALEWSESDEISAWGTYQIIRCNGCDTLSFRSIESNSEEYDYDENGEPILIETEKLYPEREKRSLVGELYLRDYIYEIPEIIQAIYRETLSAVQYNLATLAGIGIRAVIEATCQDLKAKKRNLEDKINELVGLSMLTSAGAEILHGIRLLGNDAAHRMKPPETRQITAALKVIDHLLLGVYVLPKEASVFPKPKPKPTPKSSTKTSSKTAKKKSSGKKP